LRYWRISPGADKARQIVPGSGSPGARLNSGVLVTPDPKKWMRS
jgi:hypothetical protein